MTGRKASRSTSNEPSGLQQEPTELRQDGAGGVGLVVDPVSVFAAAKNAGVGQIPELTRETGRPKA